MGFRADNTGFFYLSYAAYLCLRSSCPAQLLDDRLYALVGRHYNRSPKQVRRAICRSVEYVWNTVPWKIAHFTKLPLTRRPGGVEMVRLLLCCILFYQGLDRRSVYAQLQLPPVL